MLNDFSKIKPIEFNWDKANKEKNWHKHGVDYKECEEIFFNKPIIINFDEKHSAEEKRFQALGETFKKRGLFVSFTVRNNKIRVISARNQNKKERKIYGQK